MPLEVKGVSAMRESQDMMNNPPSAATIQTLVLRAKEIGATHIALSQPFGLPNSVSEMQRWVNEAKNQGLKVTWRLDDPSKHPMYNQPIFVGGAALSTATYLSRTDSFIRSNPSLFQDGDEWCTYYEPTTYWNGDGKVVAWFDPNKSWLSPNSSSNFSDFFIKLYDTSQAAFASIGKNVKVGLTATNGSEFLNKYIEQRLVDKVGYVCTDHYKPGDAAGLAADLRKMKANYGKPVYLQETAVNEQSAPTAQQITDYFTALNSLVADGTLVRISYWRLTGGNEALLNPDMTLNATGVALKAFFGATSPVPIPVPTPTPIPDLTPRVVTLETKVTALENKLNSIKAIL